MTDIDAAHAEALAVNRQRDRIDRWWRNGGLSPDPLRRMQADAIALIEKQMDERPQDWIIRGITNA